MERSAGLPPLLGSFERHLRAENRADTTVTTYLIAARQAETFLRTRGKELPAASRADLEAFMGDLLAHRSPSTAATYHKVLRLLYAWLELVCRPSLDLRTGTAGWYRQRHGNLRTDGPQAVFAAAFEQGGRPAEALWFDLDPAAVGGRAGRPAWRPRRAGGPLQRGLGSLPLAGPGAASLTRRRRRQFAAASAVDRVSSQPWHPATCFDSYHNRAAHDNHRGRRRCGLALVDCVGA